MSGRYQVSIQEEIRAYWRNVVQRSAEAGALSREGSAVASEMRCLAWRPAPKQTARPVCPGSEP